MSRQRILVLGAGGFIGGRVVRALAATDWAEPIAAGRRSGSAEGTGIAEIVLDANDPAAVAAAMRSVDGAVSCVAGDATTIVTSARALLDNDAIAADCPIVHFSSMAVYGSAVGTVDENAMLLGDLGSYSEAKVAAERFAAKRSGTIVLRPGCVYGPGSRQWSGRVAQWLRSGRLGDLGAAGDGWCNLVHVDDVASAVLLALRNPTASGHAFNLAMEEPPTWNEYFLRFAKALGAVPIRRLSSRQMKWETRVIAPPLKIAQLVAGRLGLPQTSLPEPIPPSLLTLWRQEIRLSMKRTVEDLGLVPRSLEEGLRETASAYPPR